MPWCSANCRSCGIRRGIFVLGKETQCRRPFGIRLRREMPHYGKLRAAPPGAKITDENASSVVDGALIIQRFRPPERFQIQFHESSGVDPVHRIWIARIVPIGRFACDHAVQQFPLFVPVPKPRLLDPFRNRKAVQYLLHRPVQQNIDEGE